MNDHPLKAFLYAAKDIKNHDPKVQSVDFLEEVITINQNTQSNQKIPYYKNAKHASETIQKACNLRYKGNIHCIVEKFVAALAYNETGEVIDVWADEINTYTENFPPSLICLLHHGHHLPEKQPILVQQGRSHQGSASTHDRLHKMHEYQDWIAATDILFPFSVNTWNSDITAVRFGSIILLRQEQTGFLALGHIDPSTVTLPLPPNNQGFYYSNQSRYDIDAIVEILQQMNIKRIMYRLDGGGDSGIVEMDEIEFQGDGNEKTLDVCIGFESVLGKSSSLKDILDDIVAELPEFDWVNNDGGHGTITICPHEDDPIIMDMVENQFEESEDEELE